MDTDDFEPKRTHPIVWQSAGIENDTTTVTTSYCRNSVQGKVLIVDDRGYVCHRPDIQWSGCCNSEAKGTKRYSCETCNANRCCMIYEHCASCCLNPNKVSGHIILSRNLYVWMMMDWDHFTHQIKLTRSGLYQLFVDIRCMS